MFTPLVSHGSCQIAVAMGAIGRSRHFDLDDHQCQRDRKDGIAEALKTVKAALGTRRPSLGHRVCLRPMREARQNDAIGAKFLRSLHVRQGWMYDVGTLGANVRYRVSSRLQPNCNLAYHPPV